MFLFVFNDKMEIILSISNFEIIKAIAAPIYYFI